MSKQYSDAFIEQALVKVYSRGSRSVQSVADELNVNYETVKNWVKRKKLDKLKLSVNKEKRPQDWTAPEQLQALNESYALSGEALAVWCRERGLFAHHLESWKEAFCAEEKSPAVAGARELRGLKEEIETLRRDALRKDKALAEAAALLVLQKKFRALWEDEVK